MGINFGWILLGASIGALAVGIIYLLSMAGYIFIRKKYPCNKFIEFFVLLFVLGINVIIKALVLASLYDASFSSGIRDGIFAVYSGVYSFLFANLDNVENITQIYLAILYVGGALYSSLMFVSVITSKASYEIYSGFMTFFLKWKYRFKLYDDVYIFTYVSEETLALARSIVEQYESTKNDRYQIIFSGPNMEKFDAKQALHRDIMAEGFIYWSYYKKSENESLGQRIKLYFNNFIFLENKKDEKKFKHIRVFAFASNSQGVAIDNENTMIVENDILFLKEMQKKKKNVPEIEYYVLSNNLEYNFFNNYFALPENADLEAIKSHTNIRIINEALLSATDKENKKTEKIINELWEYNKPNNNEFRVAVLGFGLTGQKAMENSFVNSTYLEFSVNTTKHFGDYKTSQFVADVYDEKLTNIKSIYAINHPLMLINSATNKEVEPNYEGIKKIYKSILDCSDAKKKIEADDKIWTKIKDEMKFPIINFNNVSCISEEIIYKIVDNISNNVLKEVIISLGDDETNIRVANSLITGLVTRNVDLKNKVLISVHLLNANNQNRVISDSDNVLFKNLVIVPFGARQEIYNYNNIIAIDEHVKYNSAYMAFYDIINSFGKDNIDKGILYNYSLLRNKDVPYNKTINNEFKDIKIEYSISLKEWFQDVDSFLIESNASAANFKKYFKNVFNADKDKQYTLEYYSQIEHMRWNRFHIVNGWINCAVNKKNPKFKMHFCIVPFEYVLDTKKDFDLINVLLAYVEK